MSESVQTRGSAGTSRVGTEGCPLRVAIVGSGPSGFYAADALFRGDVPVRVAMFEKLPTPFGLVRFGVAPDHAKIRNVVKTYEKVAHDDRFGFYGNVSVGADVTVEDLRRHFDAVIFAFGAASDRRLGIPGEDLPRSYTATSFCAWYNGHPDFQDCAFDFSHESAVVIGQGNVAMDVVRILALSADALAKTDMTSAAVEALRASRLKRVYIVGRRGAVQAKFTPKELKELGEIDGCDLIIDPRYLELNETDRAELELPDHKANRRNYEILKEYADRGPTGAERQVIMLFYLSPVEIRGEDGVEQVVLQRNQMVGEPGSQWAEGTGETEVLDCQLFFRSVGYRGVKLEGVPFDDKRSVIPNEKGRIKGAEGMYCTGWIKRGASGLIGTNKGDSIETVEQVLADLPSLSAAPEREDAALKALLKERGVRAVSFDDWKRIDAAEIERGKAVGKPRENFTSVDEMLDLLGD